jgi:flavin reductase (DIM6/NTAB) family NADH-FMN oxidoreductase RutF
LSPSAAEFRNAWGKFPTGVSIVTTHTEEGAPYCTTANAVSSVSLDPLLLQLSMATVSLTCANISRNGRFGINFLREEDAVLATFFAKAAGPGRGELPSSHTIFESGTIGLNDALAVMDCRVVQSVEAGDHTVFIAEVETLEVREGRPLVFYEGTFSSVTDA